MKRPLTVILAATICSFGFPGVAVATPPYETPETWQYQALEVLAADGLIDGYTDGTVLGDLPQTRRQMAAVLVKALAKLRANGAGGAPQTDLDLLDRLLRAFRDELVLLGVRETSVAGILHPSTSASPPAPALEVHGVLAADESFRQRSAVPTLAGGGPSPYLYPFVNAFQTSPAGNNPFEHDPGQPNLLRAYAKVDPTYTLDSHLAVSLPIRLREYSGDFAPNERYFVEPALVLNIANAGALQNAYVRGGILDDLPSSRLGLTYRAPDDTQQGPGFQNPVQPYEKGIELAGNIAGLTHFQISFSQIDQSAINTFPDLVDPYGTFARKDYFLVATPSATSGVQVGAPAGIVSSSHTDTFVANGTVLPFVSLTSKAVAGSVYVSSVNGTICSSAGLTPGGGACPVPSSAWYYIDATNEVVFRSPLPAGTIVQITYSTATSAGAALQNTTYNYTRYHFNVRLNYAIKGIPGAEFGFSASRIFDSDSDASSHGLAPGTGYGVVSDTVFGLDTRLPITLLGWGPGRMQHPIFFGEGAYSKFTPDFHTTPAITDSAVVAGLRFPIGPARLGVEYQAVGRDFLDGGPLRYLGPAPATFQYWHGTYFPGFFGFGNTLAINAAFDAAVNPGCAGAACASRNAGLTFIYPVFNPFVALGPQFFSAYAPNSQGLSTSLTVPFGPGPNAVRMNLDTQNLHEMIANGNGQIEFGPGFATGTRMTFERYKAGVQFGLPVLGTNALVSLTGSFEHLSRNDRTAYAYVPFNPQSGGADAASTAAVNAYLAMGNIPVLFYPNFVDEFHTQLVPTATLPVTRNLNVSVTYSTQTFHGANGTTNGQNISQRKDDSVVSLTYMMPRWNSSVGFLYGNQTYTDKMLPSYNFNQNREALDLTVRF